MRRLIKVILSTLLFIVISHSLSIGQSRKDLENERNKIISQIEIAENQIKEAKKTTEASLTNLNALNSKIDAREQLIRNLKKQLSLSLSVLKTNQDSLSVMDSNLLELEETYNKVMRLAYLRQLSSSKWISIFSAKSLNEGILLWKYAKQFQTYIENKKLHLNNLKEAINSTNQSILEEREYTDKLLEDEKQNFEQLAKTKKEAALVVNGLKEKESELIADMARKKEAREKLNKKIEETILAELAKRNSKSKPKISSLSKKKSLMWPVKNGFISSKFGQQAHPTISNLTINNNGVDISSKAKSPVYCVMDGTIVGITKMPGYDTMIIIEHGAHYTVYSKLKEATVNKGQSVSTNQKIGTLNDNGVLHFEIWKGKQKLNPKDWLQKQ